MVMANESAHWKRRNGDTISCPSSSLSFSLPPKTFSATSNQNVQPRTAIQSAVARWVCVVPKLTV
jgi:hypothetical protein